MMPWRKGLAILCVIAAALLLAATIVFVFDEDAAHVIFDYAADPGVMIVLGAGCLGQRARFSADSQKWWI